MLDSETSGPADANDTISRRALGPWLKRLLVDGAASNPTQQHRPASLLIRCTQFQKPGQMFLRPGKLRINRNRLPQVRFRLLNLSPLSMNDAAIVVRNRVVWRQPQSLIRISQSLRHVAKL